MTGKGLPMKLEAFPPQARTKQLLGQLFAVWLASVRATHTFLTEEEIQAIAPQVPDALAQVPTLVVAWEGEEPAGFLGVDGQRIEMLFLAPQHRGRGLGRQLLTYGVEHCGARQVCVNEQNPQARGFYEHLGFRVRRRTATDEQGRPYPLRYLAL